MEGKSAKSSPEPSLPEATTTRSSPHLTPPLQSSETLIVGTGALPNHQRDSMSWGTLNASPNFSEPTHAYANMSNASHPNVFPPNAPPYHQPQAQQIVQQPTSFSPYPYMIPPVCMREMFATQFDRERQQMTEWTSAAPNLTDFDGWAGAYMSTEAMVTNPGISSALERASDIDLATLFPSYGTAAAAGDAPTGPAPLPSIPRPMAASNVPLTSNQRHAYQNCNIFTNNDTLHSILTK